MIISTAWLIVDTIQNKVKQHVMGKGLFCAQNVQSRGYGSLIDRRMWQVVGSTFHHTKDRFLSLAKGLRRESQAVSSLKALFCGFIRWENLCAYACRFALPGGLSLVEALAKIDKNVT